MKNDHRIRLTKILIHKSMLELLREKPINKITVIEICKRSGLHRTTFYLHYSDIFALLDEIKEHIANIIYTIVQDATQKNSKHEFRFHINRSIVQNFEYFEFICSDHCEAEFQEQIINIARECSFSLWRKEYPNAKEADLSILYTFIAFGSVAVIRSWVQNGMRESPGKIDEYIEKISRRALGLLRDIQ